MKRDDQFKQPVQESKGTYVPPPNAVKPTWPNGRIENELTGKSVEDKVDDLLKEQCPCLFGSINVETGESCKGKMVDGKMTFEFDLWQSIKNKIRWALFGNPHKPKIVKPKPKIQKVGIRTYFTSSRWNSVESEVPIFRQYDEDDNTLRVWATDHDGELHEYDVDIWEQTRCFSETY